MSTPDAQPPQAHIAAPARHWAERVAEKHLLAKGWRLLASNYRLRGGELDLVFAAQGAIVVVEVKQRRSVAYGHPGESIDGRKLRRLRATAQHYVSQFLRRPEARVRLDAVLVIGVEERHHVQHLENIG